MSFILILFVLALFFLFIVFFLSKMNASTASERKGSDPESNPESTRSDYTFEPSMLVSPMPHSIETPAAYQQDSSTLDLITTINTSADTSSSSEMGGGWVESDGSGFGSFDGGGFDAGGSVSDSGGGSSGGE